MAIPTLSAFLLVAALPQIAAQEPQLKTGDNVYSTSQITIRVEARATARPVASLPAGTSMEVKSCSKGWCRVTAGPNNGYALAEYVSLQQPAPPATLVPYDVILGAALEQRYSLKQNKSLRRARQAFKHLERTLGADRRVSDLTQDVVNDYLQRRVDQEEAARATANYEISVLNSALSQAVENRALAVSPRLKLPRVRNTRQGFFTEGEFAAVLLELPQDVRPGVEFLHATGWRLNEALTLTWDQIDWEGLVITISGDKTKGEDDRVFPFGAAPDLKALLEARLKAREGVFVFHRSGRRIKTFIKSWRAACRRAGVTGRLVHDLRRTAARNFRRAGIDEGTIMKLCGWKTRAMFDRYNVIDATNGDAARGINLPDGAVYYDGGSYHT